MGKHRRRNQFQMSFDIWGESEQPAVVVVAMSGAMRRYDSDYRYVFEVGNPLPVQVRCPSCRTLKPYSAFNKDEGRPPYGIHTWCRDCKVRRSRERYRDNERIRASGRDGHLRRTYGISLNDYTAMFESQQGVCAICGKPELEQHRSGRVKALAVDHDHATGKVRGLLCHGCNVAVGHFRDCPMAMQSAIKYIEAHNARA